MHCSWHVCNDFEKMVALADSKNMNRRDSEVKPKVTLEVMKMPLVRHNMQHSHAHTNTQPHTHKWQSRKRDTSHSTKKCRLVCPMKGTGSESVFVVNSFFSCCYCLSLPSHITLISLPIFYRLILYSFITPFLATNNVVSKRLINGNLRSTGMWRISLMWHSLNIYHNFFRFFLFA